MSRIGIYTQFSAYIGGGERYILTLASALQNDHEVSFLCNSPAKYCELSKILNIDISNIELINFNKDNKYRLDYLAIKRDFQYDLFIAMSNHIRPPVIGYGWKNILHIQFPYPDKNQNIMIRAKNKIEKSIFQHFYDLVVVNSHYTERYVASKINHPIMTIFPPVSTKDLAFFLPAHKKNQIISVGRFVGGGDSKCQLEMVKIFKNFCDLNPTLNIKYVCVGSEIPEKIHQDYLRQVKEEAIGYPIEILTDVTLIELKNLYSQSKVFWHGKGYGAGISHPEYTEHFGISTVEAMFSGCIPIVFAAGGQLEIVQHEYNGFLWKTEQYLIEKTSEIFKNSEKFSPISKNAHTTSTKFSKEQFVLRIRELITSF